MTRTAYRNDLVKNSMLPRVLVPGTANSFIHTHTANEQEKTDNKNTHTANDTEMHSGRDVSAETWVLRARHTGGSARGLLPDTAKAKEVA